MGHSRIELAIRTIETTTRAAIKSNQAAGRDELALASARRGLTLLRELAALLTPDTSQQALVMYDEARERMDAMLADASRRALSIGDGQGSVDEEVDVRSKFGSKLS